MAQKLPIDDYLNEISEHFLSRNCLILSAEPGTGKSTRVPAHLSKNMPENKRFKVLVVQPRRIAAKSLAQRVAQEQSWALGKEVGYRVKSENLCNENTKLEFITEGVLLQILRDEESLSKIQYIVLDEFHERSLYSDLSIAILKEYQSMVPELKILIMSASMDSEQCSNFLNNAVLLNIPGTSYPLEITYSKKALGLNFSEKHLVEIYNEIRNFLTKNNRGHILVFLPGKREIFDCIEKFSVTFNSEKRKVMALYGGQSLDEQSQVLDTQSNFQKIIFSTNIAETSLTIEGLSLVIDSGLSRQAQYIAKSNLQSLVLKRISKASAKQRAGRAARSGPGSCFRLWGKLEEQAMQDYEIPEIHRSSLVDSLAYLYTWGIRYPKKFDWFEKPKEESIDFTRQYLQELKLLRPSKEQDEFIFIEPINELVSLPCELSQAVFLYFAKQLGLLKQASEWVALLQEPLPKIDLLRFSQSEESDLLVLHHQWKSLKLPKAYSVNIKNTADKIYQLANKLHDYQLDPWSQNIETIQSFYSSAEKLSAALCISHLTYLCKIRQPGQKRAKHFLGSGMELSSKSSLVQSRYFIALSSVLSQNLIKSEATAIFCHGIEENILLRIFADQFTKNDSTKEEDGKIWLERSLKLGEIEFGNPQKIKLSEEELSLYYKNYFLKNFDQLIERLPALKALHERIDFLEEKQNFRKYKETPFLSSYFESISYQKASLDEILKQDLDSHLYGLMSADDRKYLDKEAPEYLIGADNKRYKIDYSGEHAPSVKMKLQDAFFWKTHPSIGKTGTRLCFILLAPNQRPTQITKDLTGFWTGSYKEVRKELKARYPKHNWPEDPFKE